MTVISPPRQRTDPVTPSSGRSVTDEPPTLELVRYRLTLALAATALMSAIIGALFVAIIEQISDGPVAIVTMLHVAEGLTPGLIALFVAFGGSGLLILYLARSVLRPAAALDEARQRFGALYEAAREDALQDPLTGLGNHRSYQDELERQIEGVERHGGHLSLLLFDLDDFAVLNEALGYDTGDACLLEFARLLRGSIRRSDRPFRIGGDQFAVILPDTPAEEAHLVGRRLLGACLEPRASGGFGRGFSFSAGVSSLPSLADDRTALHAQADAAMFAVKQAGRSGVRVFDEAVPIAPLDEERLHKASAAVVEAIEGEHITAAYQPIVEIRSGLVTGFEGLMRPTAGSPFADPLAMITVAEATGRMSDLDRLCIRTIAAGASALEREQVLHLNLSPRTLCAEDFSPRTLIDLLAPARLAPSKIVLEASEHAGSEDLRLFRERLIACQQAGFKVAIDDIGGGGDHQSDLQQLGQIVFDTVKIDFALISAGVERDASIDVLRSLAELARRWGAKAVAEGIETPEQLRLVRALGISHAQGFLLSRPLPAPALHQVQIGPLLIDPDLRTLLTGHRLAS